MLACYLRQRHAGAAIMHNLLAVNVEPSTTDLASFEPCPAHARPDPLDNDATFEFRHRRHDDDDRPTQRTLCVYRLTLGEELNAESRKFIERLEQVLGAPRQTVARPDQEHVKSMAAGVLHHPVQRRASRTGPTESVIHVLLHNLEPALGGELPEVVQLGLGVLVYSADAHVQRGSFHLVRFSFSVLGNSLCRQFRKTHSRKSEWSIS